MIWLILGAALLVGLARPLLARPSIPASTSRIVGHLYEIGIYRDVPRQIGSVVLRLARESLLLGRHLLTPCLVLTVPSALILILLSSQSHRPVMPGETALLWVRSDRTPESLVLPAGVHSDSAPVHIGDKDLYFWRLRASQSGNFELDIAGSKSVKLTFWVDELESASPLAMASGLWARQAGIDYPARFFWCGSRKMPWWVVFVIAMVVWGSLVEVYSATLNGWRRRR